MWYLIVTLVIVFILKVLLDYRRPPDFPPGPRGLPIVGNIFDVARLQKATGYHSSVWQKLAELYGPVVGLRLGIANPLIIITGRDAVVEVLNRPEFDGRPNGFIFRYRSGGIRRGVLFTDGELWAIQRRFTMKTLKQLGYGKLGMTDMILRDAISLADLIGELRKNGPISNIHVISGAAVINSLWSLITGKRLNEQSDKERLTRIITLTKEIIQHSNIVGGIINQFPFLRYLMPTYFGFTKQMQRLTQLVRFFTNVVFEHKERNNEEKLSDFIEFYLEEMKAQKENRRSGSSTFDEYQLINVIKDLFFAGTDTTSNTIGFVLTYLTVYQKVQKKVHAEIDSAIGENSLPSPAHKNRLPYLNAAIAEVSRMASIGPTTIPHRAMMDSTFMGYTIKKDYVLLPSLKSVHMDKEHWGDPDVFRPERFINGDGEFVEDPWLIPFGLGRRRCLGESLARKSVFLFTLCLLHRYHFVLAEGEPQPCLDGIDGFTLAPPNINVIATPRNLTEYPIANRSDI